MQTCGDLFTSTLHPVRALSSILFKLFSSFHHLAAYFIRMVKGKRCFAEYIFKNAVFNLCDNFFLFRTIHICRIQKQKVSQRICGLLDFGTFDTSAQEMVECAASGEDCQAQTFFSFKYIIILWVSTCPCEVIDRADFFAKLWKLSVWICIHAYLENKLL